MADAGVDFKPFGCGCGGIYGVTEHAKVGNFSCPYCATRKTEALQRTVDATRLRASRAELEASGLRLTVARLRKAAKKAAR